MRPSSEKTVGIVGAGSWGTALAVLLAGEGTPVLLWGHRREHVERLAAERENRRYLPGVQFPASLEVTASLEDLGGCGTLLMVVPSHGYREVFRRLVPYLRSGCAVVSAVKGIENDTCQTMTQVMRQELADRADVTLAVLSGPSFAAEVAAGQPTAVTLACADRTQGAALQHMLATPRFRVYLSRDVVGLEICGAMKNVIA